MFDLQKYNKDLRNWETVSKWVDASLAWYIVKCNRLKDHRLIAPDGKIVRQDISPETKVFIEVGELALESCRDELLKARLLNLELTSLMKAK